MLFALLAWNLWPFFTAEIFYVLVSLSLFAAFAYFEQATPTLFFRIFKVLALNNVVEEAGAGDPSRFTLNEYVTAVVIAALIAYNFYASKISRSGTIRNGT